MIRMIYQGEANGAVSSSNKTGTATQIGTTAYNSTSNDNTYVGYMNNGGSTNSYATAHQNLIDSTVKSAIDSWYKTNIIDKGHSDYVDTNTGFCNDREVSSGTMGYTGAGYETQQTAYSSWGRLSGTNAWKPIQTPSLQCANKERDLFTLKNSENGNKSLTYPVGMITSDEIIFAGSFGHIKNSTHYLYTASKYWTLSPSSYGSSYATVFSIDSFGAIYSERVNTKNGLRPVINLRADIPFSGDGSEVSPYKIVS